MLESYTLTRVTVSVAAAVGLVFTAQMTIAPVDATVHSWRTVERTPFTILPVELTLINDLPLALLPGTRWKVGVLAKPEVWYYYLDGNARGMEPGGQWILGDATADIIVRTERPLTRLQLDIAGKFVPNDVTVSLLGDRQTIHIDPGAHATVAFAPPPGVWYQGSYAEVLRISTTNGFVPGKVEPVPPGRQPDMNYLGVFVSYHFEVAPEAPAGK